MFYPLVNKQFANWKMAMEIVDKNPLKMVMFHSFLYVYQRVTPRNVAITMVKALEMSGRWPMIGHPLQPSHAGWWFQPL